MSDPLPPSPLTADPWTGLAGLTPARLALGRAGSSLPTREVLKLGLAHAQARDAVHAALEADRIATALAELGLAVLRVESAAPDRATYLRRPDFGRMLSDASRARLSRVAWVVPRNSASLSCGDEQDGVGEPIPSCLAGSKSATDVAIVVADGLSAHAMDLNALPLIEALLPRFARAGLSVGPVTVATQARVALGDAVGQALGARLVLVLIGERPGLSAADSLGAYLTFEPRIGRTDAERNCVSNIRPGGLPPEAAADKIAWLCRQALALSLTGVKLKDGSDALAAPDIAPAIGG